MAEQRERSFVGLGMAIALGVLGTCGGLTFFAWLGPHSERGAVPPAAAGPSLEERIAVERARVEALTPEDHLRAAETASSEGSSPTSIARARSELDQIAPDFEPARRREVNRRLVATEREIGTAAVAAARDALASGDTATARRALEMIPEGTPAEAQRAGLLGQIERREAREQRESLARGPRPEISRDGMAPLEVYAYLRTHAHDPSSVDIQSCGHLFTEGGTIWTIDCSYRAANGFGALRLETKRFFIRNNAVVRIASVRDPR